jgi:hypothetical protein
MSLSLYDSPPPPLPPRRRKRSKKVPKLPTRNHRKHRYRTPSRKKPPKMPIKYLTDLKLKHLPMASPTGLARNPSNLDEAILLGSPLKAENLTDAVKLGMIPTARAYKPKKTYSKITHYNPNHYGVGPVEAALSPQSYVSPESYVSPPNFTPPPPTHSPPEHLRRHGGRKKSRRKLKRKRRKTKRRINKRKSRRRKVNKNKRKSRRRK